MKKKLISLVASLSIAFGITSALPKNISYEEQRVQQYREFYRDYHDKDYRLKVVGKRVDIKEDKVSDVLEIEHGNTLYDNKRSKFSDDYDSFLPKIDKEHFGYEGPDSDWYYCPHSPRGMREKAIPMEDVDKEGLPQVMKDILTLPKDLQKNIFCVVYYLIDGDSWVMMRGGTEEGTVRKIYDHLNRLDEKRDAERKDVYDGQIQPIIPAENQFLPLDVFFPPTRFVDVDNDDIPEYAVDLYCTDGSWFNSDAEIAYVTLTQWFELDKNSETGRARKYKNPFKISMDFDIGKDYEQEGFDIAFYDENHDGYFERYELLKGIKK